MHPSCGIHLRVLASLAYLSAACPSDIRTPPKNPTAGAGGIIPTDRRTTWDPGNPGGIPSRTTICATVDAAYGDGRTDATAAIQSAIEGCPEGQVVLLPAGTYRLTSNLEIKKGIVLRGAGPTLTRLRATLAPNS